MQNNNVKSSSFKTYLDGFFGSFFGLIDNFWNFDMTFEDYEKKLNQMNKDSMNLAWEQMGTNFSQVCNNMSKKYDK
ncbi:MAG: hypothetical protein Ta2D_03140 [Rickettsiales bacterium]|nr:MAG: hypothetical protein Ta2D_03140 [Rickettsiales bacterium]